jgi:hypothetical protein
MLVAVLYWRQRHPEHRRAGPYAERRSCYRQFKALLSAIPQPQCQLLVGACRGKLLVQPGMRQQWFGKCRDCQHSHCIGPIAEVCIHQLYRCLDYRDPKSSYGRTFPLIVTPALPLAAKLSSES